MKIKEINQHNNFSIIIIFSLIFCDIFSYSISYYLVLHLLTIPAIINYPILIIIGILSLFRFFGRYNPSSLESRLKEIKIIFTLTSISTFIYLVYKIGFKVITIQQSQNIVLLSLIFLSMVLILRLLIRTIQKQLLKYNIGLRNTIVIASGEKGFNLLEKINSKYYSGFNILGYFDSSTNKKVTDFLNINNSFYFSKCYQGDIDEVQGFIKSKNIKEVLIALENKEYGTILNMISNLRNLDVCIKIVPDIYDLLTGYAQMHSVTGMPLIDINPNILTELQIFLKRLIDIFMSLFGLIISFPILLIVALIIKVSTKGKIIFKQERIGLNGIPFSVHKFRTMYENSEKYTGPVWAKVNDPRITKIGYYLRKTRIDEFPQLFDVLIGNMSIVGPRPERDFFVSKLKKKFPYYNRRLNVRPGITGWAQIMGSYDTDIESVENKLKLDFYYIENISIWLDIKIMIITIWVMISSRGQ
jgi:exopolysaccharide biosynthesis polyprenyl glycosylphosphotransferase